MRWGRTLIVAGMVSAAAGAVLVHPVAEIRRPQDTPHQASQTGLSVFVVNFQQRSTAPTMQRIFAEQVGRADVAVVIDALDRSLVAYYEAGDRVLGRRLDSEQAIQMRYQNAPSDHPINLAQAIDAAQDVINRYAGRLSFADVFIVDSAFHDGGGHKFSEGYPNDGFLLKDDTEFGFVRRLNIQNSHLHVLGQASGQYSAQYQRFFTHAGKQYFGADLATFSFSPTAGGMSVGDRPVVDIAPLDTRVPRSFVVKPPQTPVCRHDDQVRYDEISRSETTVTITNPDRANAILDYRLKSGDELSPEQTVRANDAGIATVQVRRRPGETIVLLRGCDNVERAVLTLAARPSDDEIQIGEPDNGLVELVGRNAMRSDGDEVTITHPASNKTWTARVENGEYKVKIPAIAGRQIFNVSRVGGGPPQVVTVNTTPACSERDEATEVRGTGTIRVYNTCRAGREITFQTGEDRYRSRFDSNGLAEIKLSLVCGPNEIFYESQDGSRRRVELKFDCSEVVKITLKWQANVDLDLHVREPNSERGKAGYIYHANQNRDGPKKGIGSLDIDCKGDSDCPGLKIENYQAQSSRLPTGKWISIYVDHYTRGGTPGGTYCGAGDLATVPFEVIIVNRGRVETIKGRTESKPCGVPLKEEGRFQSVQRVRIE
jgi:hypothetical protein